MLQKVQNIINSKANVIIIPCTWQFINIKNKDEAPMLVYHSAGTLFTKMPNAISSLSLGTFLDPHPQKKTWRINISAYRQMKTPQLWSSNCTGSLFGIDCWTTNTFPLCGISFCWKYLEHYKMVGMKCKSGAIWFRRMDIFVFLYNGS